MGLGQEHWFGFKDSCIYVSESTPFCSLPQYPLFFLHGRFGQGEMWIPLIESLSSTFRCFAVDLPGFGRSFSPRERAFSLLEHTSLINELISKFTPPAGSAVLIGHDVGGVIAQLCSLKFPERVSALILINSVALTRELEKIGIGLYGWLARLKLGRLLKQAHTMSPYFRTALADPWKNSTSRKALISSFRAFDESWPWHYERQSWKKAIQDMSQPVLLLWGKNDTLNPPSLGIEMLQKLPEAYFFVNEEAGHWPNLEQPQWVVSKMKDFIFKIGFGLNIKNVQKSLLR